MNVRKQRSLVGSCLKFKLEEDFEVRNFKYLWKTVDRNVECSTKYGQLYGMWWGSTILPARQKKILSRFWKDMKWIKLHVKVLHLIMSSQVEYKVVKVRNRVSCVVFCCQFLELNYLWVWNKFRFFVYTVKLWFWEWR